MAFPKADEKTSTRSSALKSGLTTSEPTKPKPANNFVPAPKLASTKTVAGVPAPKAAAATASTASTTPSAAKAVTASTASSAVKATTNTAPAVTAKITPKPVSKTVPAAAGTSPIIPPKILSPSITAKPSEGPLPPGAVKPGLVKRSLSNDSVTQPVKKPATTTTAPTTLRPSTPTLVIPGASTLKGPKETISDPEKAKLVKQLREILPSRDGQAKWISFCKVHGEGKTDPKAHDVPLLQTFLDAFRAGTLMLPQDAPPISQKQSELSSSQSDRPGQQGKLILPAKSTAPAAPMRPWRDAALTLPPPPSQASGMASRWQNESQGSSFAGSDASKVFVGSLPKHITEESVFSFFSQFGAVQSVELKYEGMNVKGFGFVTFSTSEEAQWAIDNDDNNIIDGKWIEVRKASAGGGKGQKGSAASKSNLMADSWSNGHTSSYPSNSWSSEYGSAPSHPATDSWDSGATYNMAAHAADSWTDSGYDSKGRHTDCWATNVVHAGKGKSKDSRVGSTVRAGSSRAGGWGSGNDPTPNSWGSGSKHPPAGLPAAEFTDNRKKAASGSSAQTWSSSKEYASTGRSQSSLGTTRTSSKGRAADSWTSSPQTVSDSWSSSSGYGPTRTSYGTATRTAASAATYNQSFTTGKGSKGKKGKSAGKGR